jgi:hypothetical protein
MVGFGVISVGLAIAYWLVRNARTAGGEGAANP